MNKIKSSEIKRMIISSLDIEPGDEKDATGLREALAWDFRDGFEKKILGRISNEGIIVKRQYEFRHNLNLAFYRVAFTAAAAIILLMLSIFLKEGSLSFDSLLGMSDGYSESIVCLLTGN